MKSPQAQSRPGLGFVSVALIAVALLPSGAGAATAAAGSLSDEHRQSCEESVRLTAREGRADRLLPFCREARLLPDCKSHEGRAIPHLDIPANRSATPDRPAQRILVLGLIHGDEPLAGELSLAWAQRLREIEPRNHWRVIPLLNPDGLRRKSRVNARGVDLNRNFPTRDWASNAHTWWQKQAKSDPRRFPGESASSEPETRCSVQHIDDFKPDLIVSNHTPYAVLDFDGPRVAFPAYRELPWRALGNFPGSLGRFMWRDQGVPVLTVELGESMVDQDALQDVIGTLAILARRQNPDLDKRRARSAASTSSAR